MFGLKKAKEEFTLLKNIVVVEIGSIFVSINQIKNTTEATENKLDVIFQLIDNIALRLCALENPTPKKKAVRKEKK